MTLSRREAMLTGITLSVVLLGGTLWFGLPMLKQWRTVHGKSTTHKNRVEMAQRLLRQSDEIAVRLRKLQESMPEYDMETDVTSQLLKNLQRTSDRHGLILLRQEPENEARVGDLYEMAINCSWEGSLDSLTHFLYALHSQGAMVDVRHLSIAPSGRQGDRLKGSLKVDYAYSRFDIPAPISGEEPEPAAEESSATP